jgi:hypothetical protein
MGNSTIVYARLGYQAEGTEEQWASRMGELTKQLRTSDAKIADANIKIADAHTEIAKNQGVLTFFFMGVSPHFFFFYGGRACQKYFRYVLDRSPDGVHGCGAWRERPRVRAP